MEYGVTFNGERCERYGLLPMHRPNIPAPVRRISRKEVSGRDGILVESDGCHLAVEIQISFNFMNAPDRWAETFRGARKWLRGSGELEFSDDPEYFRKVYYCEIQSTERVSRKIGKFDANFVCHPAEFVKAGQQRLFPDQVDYNPYSVSHPIYYISGDGECTLTVNGKVFTMTVYDNMVIDTDRWISYREYDRAAYLLTHDGSPLLVETGVPLILSHGREGDTNDQETYGDYTDLYLLEGENTFSITAGFTLEIMPNWRCL